MATNRGIVPSSSIRDVAFSYPPDGYISPREVGVPSETILLSVDSLLRNVLGFAIVLILYTFFRYRHSIMLTECLTTVHLLGTDL